MIPMLDLFQPSLPSISGPNGFQVAKSRVRVWSRIKCLFIRMARSQLGLSQLQRLVVHLNRSFDVALASHHGPILLDVAARRRRQSTLLGSSDWICESTDNCDSIVM